MTCISQSSGFALYLEDYLMYVHHVAKQASLSISWFKPPKTGFLMTWLIITPAFIPRGI